MRRKVNRLILEKQKSLNAEGPLACGRKFSFGEEVVLSGRK
jgi:hypothetical protein